MYALTKYAKFAYKMPVNENTFEVISSVAN